MVFLSLQVSLNLWNETKWEKYYWWRITSCLNYINSKYFWDNGELRLYQQFLINVPKKSWMISYTVCHLLLTGFLKWSNFPHQSKENNWNCFSLFFKIWSNDLYFDLKINFFFREIFFFFFSTKIVIQQLFNWNISTCCVQSGEGEISILLILRFSLFYFHLEISKVLENATRLLCGRRICVERRRNFEVIIPIAGWEPSSSFLSSTHNRWIVEQFTIDGSIDC